MVIDPYATGVLTEEVHNRLVANIENIAAGAMIQPKWIWTPLAQTVTPPIINWVKRYAHYHAEGVSGLVITGPKYDVAATTISAITGALLRNFIDAQVITTQQLYDRLKHGNAPDPTCLLIPNFYAGKAHGVKLAHWEIASLQDLILDRHMRGRMTVIYVTDVNSMGEEYGTAVRQLVDAHYISIGIGGGLAA